MPASDEIRRALATTGRLTVLTGAGVSAESGIATFRDRGGLWEEHRLEDVATPEAFDRDPAFVHRFYNARRCRLPQVSPNPAHFALACLEEALGDRFTLITQNVDDLHERAGSRRVLHMHGELLKARCASCGKVLPWPGDLGTADRCASCRGPLRPHVVWFGEVPFHLEDEIPRALEAEVFMACGTSGSVYPAAAMVLEAKLRGRLTVEVNLEASEQARHFDLSVLGPAGTTLPRLVEEILLGPPRTR